MNVFSYQAEIATMSSCVPDEPPVDAGEKVCTFRIRFPDGQQQQRRFLATHTLQVQVLQS